MMAFGRLRQLLGVKPMFEWETGELIEWRVERTKRRRRAQVATAKKKAVGVKVKKVTKKKGGK
jgi:hydroxypyruvate isomerase